MYPELVPGVSSYSVFLGLAVATGCLVTTAAGKRAGLASWRLAALQLALATTALGGAKLWSWWERGALGPAAFEAFHNYRYPGGLLAAAAALLLTRRLFRISLSLAALGDLVAPSIAFAMAVVRIGCFLAGCCFGTPSDLPWALRFPEHSPAWEWHLAAGRIIGEDPHSLPVHPLELYFGLWSLCVGTILLRTRRRSRYSGQVALEFLVLHEGGKFFLEFLRGDPRPYVQLGSLIAALSGLSVSLVVRHRCPALLAPEQSALGRSLTAIWRRRQPRPDSPSSP